MAFGAGLHGNEIQFYTCDQNPFNEKPLEGVSLPKGSGIKIFNSSSTEMFRYLLNKNIKIDMLHLDGRLLKEDIEILQSLISEDTLIAIDDCEGNEKGHENLHILKHLNTKHTHVFVAPFARDSFLKYQLNFFSSTGFLIPIKSIKYSNQ